MTHIARTRSPNCQLGSSKLSTAIVQRSILTPIPDAKVVLAEENQETDDVISSGISVRSPVAPVNGLSAEPSVAPEVIHEIHDQKCEQNHISAPESLRPLTTFDVITDLGSINAECGPFPASPERSFVVSEALMDPEPDLTPAPSPPKPHLKSATQVETESDSDSVPTSMHTESYSTTELWLPPTNSPPDTCTPLVEVPASVTPIPVVEQDASLPYHIDESAGHNIDELSICQQKPEVFGHMVTATSIASVLDTGVYASPENSVKSFPLSQQLRLTISKQQPNDFTPDPIVEVTQSDTTFIEAVLPSAEMESHPTQTIQPFLYQLLPDREPSDHPPSILLNAERFQTPMEITTTPEPQAALTEAGQNSGETLTSEMCLPVDAQGQSQHGLAYDTSGANNPAFISTSNSVDEHSDTVYMDYQPSGPSDAELLELAAAVLATEAMDWDLNAWNPDTFGLGSNDNTTAQSQTDIDLLALDALLNLNGAPLSSPGPQLSNSTLENTHTSPSHSSVALFTEEELLALASSASAENSSETMLVDQTFTDFDLDLTHASISPLDSSQLELLDHATRLVMADLPSTTPGPSGIANSNNTATLDSVDASDLGTCIDSNELARMWSDLGASLQGWAAHIPDVMDFSEESIAGMMKELDALDSTPEPAHTPVNDTPEPALVAPVPMTQPRKIKNLPLRRAVAKRA
ncbi:hypothetical protein RSOLAG1IB_05111 [Rhizoctonia solani AG-1 IB]|uniref:Uncharacterized protein n=1 Tax=Thanatephorus cucumeris (strain AG1-IB / isolate 7/3/14) TaxID=1108050 RepID=A0A0B7G2N9_THACB|nr:hypothetical protein RSOLAG1IB_05111 [Rhizoctonia solani AG-1 IB]